MSTSYSYFANAAPTGTGNGDQRLETITHKQGSTQLSNFGHTYNPVGTIATWTQQTTSGSTATTNTLSYDTADQLTKDVQSGGATASNAYNYDPDGNRLLETTLTGATAGQFNNLNQLKGLTAGPGMQTVAGHTSAAVSSVNLDTVAATLSGSTNFTANVSMPSGTNIVSVVAQPSATGTTPTRKSTRSWPRARLPPR
jgi:YD repeat-containing protein